MGPKRIASFRTMKLAVKRFRKAAGASCTQESLSGDLLIDFWCAVAIVLKPQWEAPRHHMLAKGIGVYCLMSVAGAFDGTPR